MEKGRAARRGPSRLARGSLAEAAQAAWALACLPDDVIEPGEVWGVGQDVGEETLDRRVVAFHVDLERFVSAMVTDGAGDRVTCRDPHYAIAKSDPLDPTGQRQDHAFHARDPPRRQRKSRPSKAWA